MCYMYQIGLFGLICEQNFYFSFKLMGCVLVCFDSLYGGVVCLWLCWIGVVVIELIVDG